MRGPPSLAGIPTLGMSSGGLAGSLLPEPVALLERTVLGFTWENWSVSSFMNGARQSAPNMALKRDGRYHGRITVPGTLNNPRAVVPTVVPYFMTNLVTTLSPTLF